MLELKRARTVRMLHVPCVTFVYLCSPSRRPHLLDPYRDVPTCPSGAPGPVRRHDAIAAVFVHGEGSVQHTVDLPDCSHAHN